MNMSARVWLAADFHFPSLYSCRIPLSSANAATVMPTPGPSTVRLALIRTGIELFGIEEVRTSLFPSICSLAVQIKPPEHVAITAQTLRAYKPNETKRAGKEYYQDALITREFAHASNAMTLYLEVPCASVERFTHILQTIGYWGKSDSLTCCLDIREQEPVHNQCALPLNSLSTKIPAQHFFSCFVQEFQSANVAWEAILPTFQPESSNPFRLELYVWPLLIIRQQGGSTLLQYHEF